MMKLCLALALAALPLLAAGDDCDLKKVEKGLYCEKCDALVEKDDLDKEGRHDCKSKPVEVKVCLKTYYVADC